MKKISKAAEEAHKKALIERRCCYVDPDTGQTVMTEQYLWERGWCCKSGCRHCPYT